MCKCLADLAFINLEALDFRRLCTEQDDSSPSIIHKTLPSLFHALQAMASHLMLTCALSATFLLSLLARHPVKAAEYTVGDADEWNTGTNYLLWSKKYNFTVGDVLVFKYVQAQHNVYRVTEETYRSCDWSSGVVKTYDSGDDSVILAEATSYWFICAVNGHCQGGMKLGVSVANSSSNGGGAGAAAAAPPSWEQGSVAARGHMGWWWKAWVLCLSLGLLNWLNY